MGKLRYWLRNLSQCHFVQHTSQTDWPGINSRPLECGQFRKTYTIYTAQTVTYDRFLIITFYKCFGDNTWCLSKRCASTLQWVATLLYYKQQNQQQTGLVLCQTYVLKRSCKPNTKFPLKTAYFLGHRGLTSSYIVYDYTTSGNMDL